MVPYQVNLYFKITIDQEYIFVSKVFFHFSIMLETIANWTMIFFVRKPGQGYY